MAYDLIDLNFSSAPKDRCYFFDSNILLPVLGLPSTNTNTDNYLSYFRLVYKNCLAKPEFKIYTCANQLSEVFNILMDFEFKKIYTEEQKKIHPNPKKFFKEIFRPSDNYAKTFKLYKDEFLNYKGVFELADIGGQGVIDNVLDFDINKLDMNDWFILKAVQKTNAILVSNDNDFYGQDITHATFLRATITNFKNSVQPKR